MDLGRRTIRAGNCLSAKPGKTAPVFEYFYSKHPFFMKQLSIAACAALLLTAACRKPLEYNTVVPIDVARESYELPGDSVFPEGIAYNPVTGHFYTGSTSNGDIIKVDVQTGIASLWASGAGQGRSSATGLKLDAMNRLWICGGADAKVSVLDANGSLKKMWDLGAIFGAGFINDCVMDETHVYFTDSRVRKIYRASLNDTTLATMEEWLSFTDAEIPYNAAATNANGIALTPDGQQLIVVVSSSGKLYRISKADKSITEIPLDAPVTAGDGLVLEDHTLYVSRNALNQIFPVAMTAGYQQGTVGAGFGTNLLFNTTIARAGNYLLAVNGQLNRRAAGNPVLPFTVSRVIIP
jgi:Cu-Zn family superoxide dismutase